MDVARIVAEAGGVARTRELSGAGCTPWTIARAVHQGQIVRLRIGWFGVPALPEPVARAHRVGGPPACATVAALAGLWMLTEPRLHIEAVREDSRFRSQSDAARAIRLRERRDVVVHWVDQEARSARPGQALSTALVKMTTCCTDLEAICAIDSAIHRKVVTLEALESRGGPTSKRILASCDERAESGVESVFRIRARRAGFSFVVQAEIPGGRADFFFGERLLVEVDGEEFHAGRDAFISDRERDAWHKAIGYFVVRFSYDQVIRRWHEVESVLRLIHARGDHLWPARIRKDSMARR